MILQILIPHYDEPYETIRPLLTSIALQQGIDFAELGVIICNDGDDVIFDRDALKKYPFDIQYIVQEHRGVSATRQTCLDLATADFMMFCDTDDMFTSLTAIHDIIDAIFEADYNMIDSTFVQENKADRAGITADFQPIRYDQSFIHGKIFRRSYLQAKNIRWNPAFTIQEDEYFVYLAFGCLDSPDQFGYIEDPFYDWKYREDSLSRDDKFLLRTYVNVLETYTAVIREFIARGNIESAQHYTTSMVYDIYYTIQKPEWIDPANKGYLDQTSERFAEFYKEFEPIFESAPDEMKQRISSDIRNLRVDEGMRMEQITFDDWIESIKAEGTE